VAQQQRHANEGADAYHLRLREASGTARMLQMVPSAAVLSQIAAPMQVAAQSSASAPPPRALHR
jgi:hypothetical protein